MVEQHRGEKLGKPILEDQNKPDEILSLAKSVFTRGFYRFDSTPVAPEDEWIVSSRVSARIPLYVVGLASQYGGDHHISIAHSSTRDHVVLPVHRLGKYDDSTVIRIKQPWIESLRHRVSSRYMQVEYIAREVNEETGSKKKTGGNLLYVRPNGSFIDELTREAFPAYAVVLRDCWGVVRGEPGNFAGFIVARGTKL